MIEFDQPNIFNDKIIAALSSAEDGNMKFGMPPDPEARPNRENFLAQVDIDPTQTTLLSVSYQDNINFTRYVVFDDDQQGEGMLSPESQTDADAAVVTRPGHAIFLPLADCVGAIIYDPKNEILMVSHLGRHSVEQMGAVKSINYLKDQFDSDPVNLLIWLSPSVGSDTYPLDKFAGRSLQEVVIDGLLTAGVLSANIEASQVDTSESADYFSHSEYLAGNRDTNNRFAIVAMMRD
jgi:copper oxidase (laccase) domain-containing protein